MRFDSTILINQTGLNETIFHLNGPANIMKINKKCIQVISNKNMFIEINTDVRIIIFNLWNKYQMIIDLESNQKLSFHGYINNKFYNL